MKIVKSFDYDEIMELELKIEEVVNSYCVEGLFEMKFSEKLT